MADIGSTLRETRMRDRIDITTVESATKIRAKYLRALENEEWDLLPGPTFVRTFLRTYGDYLGLDSKMLVEEYKQRFEQPGPQEMMPFSSRGGGSGGRQRAPHGVPPWLIVGAVVALLLGALFALGTFGDDDNDPAVPAATATATAAPADGNRRERRDRRRERRSAAQPKTVSLTILPEAEVNVCLVGADGEPLINSENLTEPTERFRGKRLRVTFGNGLVRMRVDGKAFPVEDSDSAVGFELTPGSAPEPLPADELPDCL